MDASKDYAFTIAWGAETETDDREGAITRQSETRPATADLENLLPQFTGRIEQTPPVYSAIKLAGRRAYDLARNNETVDMPPREVDIHSLSSCQQFCRSRDVRGDHRQGCVYPLART